MPTLHLWRWNVTDPVSGCRSKTRWVLTEAEALARDPKAVRVPNTLEVRETPEGGLPAHSTHRNPFGRAEDEGK